MLACARIGAPHNVVFGGFSAESVARADGVLRRERADHGRRRAAQGQDRAGQVDGRRDDGSTSPPGDDPRRPAHRRAVPDARGPRHLVARRARGGRRATARPSRMDAEHPLFILYSSRLDGEAEGDPAHHRRLPDRRRRGRSATSSTSTPEQRRLLVHAPTSAGSPATATSSTGRSRTARPSVMFEGAPDYPRQGHLVGARRAYRVTIFYTAPTAIRTCMKWGAEYPAATTCPRCGCSARSASRSTPRRGSGTDRSSAAGAARSSTPGGRPRPAQIMITPLPGRWPHQARLGGRAAARHRRRRSSTTTGARSSATCRACWCCAAPGPACCAPCTRSDDRYRPAYWAALRAHDLLRRRRRAPGRRRLLLDRSGASTTSSTSSGHRLSTRRGRVGDRRHPKVAEAAVIGQTTRTPASRSSPTSRCGGDLDGEHALETELREHVAERIGKLARPKRIIWADELPKTRSGKIMRRLLARHRRGPRARRRHHAARRLRDGQAAAGDRCEREGVAKLGTVIHDVRTAAFGS